MSEPVKVWIVRSRDHYCALLHTDQPEWNTYHGRWESAFYAELSHSQTDGIRPRLAPGECRCFLLVEAEDEDG